MRLLEDLQLILLVSSCYVFLISDHPSTRRFALKQSIAALCVLFLFCVFGVAGQSGNKTQAKELFFAQEPLPFGPLACWHHLVPALAVAGSCGCVCVCEKLAGCVADQRR